MTTELIWFNSLLRKCIPMQKRLVVQMVKNLPAMQETRFQSLGWEDPLQKGMATHSRILAWRIPWIEEPGGLQSVGLQRVRGTQGARGESRQTGVVGNRAVTVSLSEVGCEGTGGRGGASQRKTPRAGGHRTLLRQGDARALPELPGGPHDRKEGARGTEGVRP